jgi:MipA family protein
MRRSNYKLQIPIAMAVFALTVVFPASARDWQITAGPLLEYGSSFPGARSRSISPGVFVEFHDAGSRARPETQDASRIEWIDEEDYQIGFAFNVRQGRSRSDITDAEYTGLPKIDTTLELGAFALRRFGQVELGVDVLQGVNGHDGLLISSELAYESSSEARFRWRVAAVANYADSNFSDAYFSSTGVSQRAVPIANFAAGSGLRDVGISAAAFYDLSDAWVWVMRARVQNYMGDAADSSLVKLGREVETSIGLGIAYTF